MKHNTRRTAERLLRAVEQGSIAPGKYARARAPKLQALLAHPKGVIHYIDGAADAIKWATSDQVPESLRHVAVELRQVLSRACSQQGASTVRSDIATLSGYGGRAGSRRGYNDTPCTWAAPRGSIADRLEGKRCAAVRNAAGDKGARIPYVTYGELAEQIGLCKNWTLKALKFNLAAPRNTFVTDVEFHSAGNDASMVYKLTTRAVAGRGFNRYIGRIDSTYFATLIELGDAEYIGVAKSIPAALAQARGKAGESVAKTLGGDFEGGFL